MKISHWFIVAGLIAPLFACSSSDDSNSGGAAGDAGSGGGGSGGSVIPSGGTGGTGTGGTGAGETGGTGGSGGVIVTIDECKASAYTDPTCGSCLEAQCATECEACYADANCIGWYSCIVQNQCSDAACEQACLDQFPGGDVPAKAWLIDCVGTKCAQECGAGAGCNLTVGDPTCDACFTTKCTTECIDFMGEPTWEALIACYQGCEDEACVTGCDEQYPAAAAALTVFDACMASQCSAECGGGAGTDCGLTVGDPVCDTCFDTKCNAECKAFAGDPNWQALLTCYKGCTTQDCADECDSQYPTAAATLTAFDECMATNCATECGGGAGTDCGLTVGDPVCDECFDTKCNAECKAFAGDPNWEDLLNCYKGCTDEACAETCDSQYPTTAAALTAFDECMATNCATECAANP